MTGKAHAKRQCQAWTAVNALIPTVVRQAVPGYNQLLLLLFLLPSYLEA